MLVILMMNSRLMKETETPVASLNIQRTIVESDRELIRFALREEKVKKVIERVEEGNR